MTIHLFSYYNKTMSDELNEALRSVRRMKNMACLACWEAGHLEQPFPISVAGYGNCDFCGLFSTVVSTIERKPT